VVKITTKDKEENKEEKCFVPPVPPWIISWLASDHMPLLEARRDKTKDKDLDKVLRQCINSIFEKARNFEEEKCFVSPEIFREGKA